ncbi:hypothetical protein QCA50_018565 [Cerrena zonata]|uniref:Uncharacterized protein n=1 Tax=Cerrena zonata TaxID=2478898 RepID=A0AAW0FK04_9APHY
MSSPTYDQPLLIEPIESAEGLSCSPAACPEIRQSDETDLSHLRAEISTQQGQIDTLNKGLASLMNELAEVKAELSRLDVSHKVTGLSRPIATFPHGLDVRTKDALPFSGTIVNTPLPIDDRLDNNPRQDSVIALIRPVIHHRFVLLRSECWAFFQKMENTLQRCFWSPPDRVLIKFTCIVVMAVAAIVLTVRSGVRSDSPHADTRPLWTKARSELTARTAF